MRGRNDPIIGGMKTKKESILYDVRVDTKMMFKFVC